MLKKHYCFIFISLFYYEKNIIILESEPDKINDTKDNSMPMNLFSEEVDEFVVAVREFVDFRGNVP